MTLNRGGKMGLSVKRTSIISLESRMELDKKGVGVDLGGKKLKDLLENANKSNNKNNNAYCYFNFNIQFLFFHVESSPCIIICYFLSIFNQRKKANKLP